MPRGFWRLNMTLDVLLLFYGIGFSMELEQDMQLYEWVLIGHWTRMVWKWLKRESCVMKSVVVPKAPGAASGSATKGHLNFIVSDASFVKSTKRGRLSSVSIWLPSFLLILTFYSSVMLFCTLSISLHLWMNSCTSFRNLWGHLQDRLLQPELSQLMIFQSPFCFLLRNSKKGQKILSFK